MSTILRNPLSPARVANAPPHVERDRFVEALRPRTMGPRLAEVVGGRASACRVHDAKYEPGVRATVLYQHDGRRVRGDLLPGVNLPVRAAAARDPAAALVVAPGVAISPFLRTYLETRGDDSALPRILWHEAVALERKALRAGARSPGSPVASGLVREANACLDRLMGSP
jgi:hypothetical protein